MRRLWEAEVANRNAVGKKLLDMENTSSTWDQQLQRERTRVSRALAKKTEAEERLRRALKKQELAQHRIGQLESDCRAQREKVQLYESGTLRPSIHSTELEGMKQRYDDEISRLRLEAKRLSQQLNEDDRGRVAQLMQAQKTQEAELARNESLMQHINQLQQELQKMRQLQSSMENDYVHRDDVDRIIANDRKAHASRLNTKLTEVNQALENDAAIRDALDKHRQLGFEETVEVLRKQLAKARSQMDYTLAS